MNGNRKRHRTSLDILRDVLEVIDKNGEATITRIASEANVPHSRLKGLMNRLVNAGVVEEVMNDDGRRLYSLTEKGIRVLTTLRDLRSFLSALGLI